MFAAAWPSGSKKAYRWLNKMASIVIYTTGFCPFCIRAKQLLDSKGADYQELAVDRDPQLRQTMMADSGRHTVPQIWINNQHIGGCDELYGLERAGELDNLLN